MEQGLVNNLKDKKTKLKVGCVLFDYQENEDGKNMPVFGTGWASISGGPAFRIRGVNDLSNDVKWITNLHQEYHWKSGAVKYSKLKHSGYFRTDVSMMMKELGMSIQRLTTAKVCENLSGIFIRIIQVASEFFDIESLNESDFPSEIKNVIIDKDDNINNYVDEALLRSYQDIVNCTKELPKGKKIITLRIPRFLHSQNILNSAVPLLSEKWEFYDEENLPEDFDERKSFLLTIKKPFVAKISLEPFQDGRFSNLLNLLNLGEATGERGRRVVRNWVSQNEFLFLRKFADIKVSAVFVSENGYKKLQLKKGLPNLGPLSSMSYSLGILSECFWISLASRSTNPMTKTKTLVTPRACWLRSSDRFYTFTAAFKLRNAGFDIISYGVGAVTVAVDEKNIKKLVDLASRAGLVPPLNMFDNFYVSSEV